MAMSKVYPSHILSALSPSSSPLKLMTAAIVPIPGYLELTAQPGLSLDTWWFCILLFRVVQRMISQSFSFERGSLLRIKRAEVKEPTASSRQTEAADRLTSCNLEPTASSR